MQKRRRFKQPEALEVRLAEEAARLRKRAQGSYPGVERERLIRRARQAETAALLSQFLRPTLPRLSEVPGRRVDED
ncbi:MULTISPECIES: hypothetical protein [unclassified Bradyrhizobium]